VSGRAVASALCGLSIALSPPAQGFYDPFHDLLIIQSFRQVEQGPPVGAARLSEIIDLTAAIEASTQLDDDENRASDQYKHSMRPNGLDIAAAKGKSARDIDDQRSDAIRAAVRGDRVTAGRLIGRILHAVQDRKHLWCSCGPGSNPPQSRSSCNSGPCSEGYGNHGLPDDCNVSLRRLGSVAAVDLKSFQLRTDFDPEGDQWNAAMAQSIEELRSFLAGYTSALKTP